MVELIEELPNVKRERIQEVLKDNFDNIFNFYKQKSNYNE